MNSLLLSQQGNPSNLNNTAKKKKKKERKKEKKTSLKMNRGIGTLETIVICLTFSSFEFQKERKEIGTGKKKLKK